MHFPFWSIGSEDKSLSVATENGYISSFRWNICYWFRYISYSDAWKPGIIAGSNYFAGSINGRLTDAVSKRSSINIRNSYCICCFKSIPEGLPWFR